MYCMNVHFKNEYPNDNVKSYLVTPLTNRAITLHFESYAEAKKRQN